jgi:hypothetical protein
VEHRFIRLGMLFPTCRPYESWSSWLRRGHKHYFH